MEIRNLIEIETAHGFKAIELCEGDVTLLPQKIDLLVVSAYKNDYIPTSGSIIGALKEKLGIDVHQLAQRPEFDFSDSLGVWISAEINHAAFSRIACVEFLDYSGVGEVETSVNSLFGLISFCQMHNVIIREMAMPLIGSGQQRISPDKLLPFIIPACQKLLNNHPELRKIILIEREESKLAAFDAALNQYLIRSAVDVQTIPKSTVINNLKKEILIDLRHLRQSMEACNPAHRTVGELAILLEKSEVRFFELGLMVRRAAEAFVKDILGEKNLKSDLLTSIDNLRSKKNISNWITGYLHILRTFGNEAAHDKDNSQRNPSDIQQKDIITLLHCLSRIIEFWREYRAK
jgi:hypothetical protein